ncbi:MAG: hypothetical protein QXV17_05195 [Candidatus Micrarchaeaceae archaeon]
MIYEGIAKKRCSALIGWVFVVVLPPYLFELRVVDSYELTLHEINLFDIYGGVL